MVKSIDFANHVAYIINRELDLADLKGYSFLEMVQDGVFGKNNWIYVWIGNGKGLGLQKEHLIEIVLSISWNGYYV